MKDYYSVLGINKNATDEEVKAAYKEMAKKYHPDNYADNPLSDLAAEKMKEINEAYDGIMNERRRHKSSSGKAGGNYYRPNSNFSDVRNLITKNRLEEAQEILDGVPPERRDAEWYFLNGTVLYKRGWFDNAYTNFATACRMDPMNPEYREALNRIQYKANGNFGNNPYRSAPNMGGMSACDCCSNLLCADCCCECMGGDLIPCC